MKNQGYTLIELLVSIALVGVILTLSSVGFSHFYRRQQTIMIAGQLFEAMQFARTQALTRHQTIGICGTQDFQHCSTDWSRGFMVFKAFTPTYRQSILPHQIIHQNHWQTAAHLSSQQQIAFYFTPEGRSLTRGTLSIKDENDSKNIIVFDSGRIRFITS